MSRRAVSSDFPMHFPMRFPMHGVVGVLGGTVEEVDRILAETRDKIPAGLGGFEVRADLFPTAEDALAFVTKAATLLPVLFTVRLKEQGGCFEGSETERLKIYGAALECGAVLVDAEWESVAAKELAERGAPVIFSHHDFDGMIELAALERLTRDAESLKPRAIKVVPTASSPADGLRMLEWVAAGGEGKPRRIGFAMGEMGVASRVLSMAWGAPFTYAAFARSVAPGQVSVSELGELYRAAELGRSTRVFGVIGRPVSHSLSPQMHNAALAARGLNAVYLPLALGEFADLEPLLEPLQIDGVSVTIPFKEDACRYAEEKDADVLSCGAANTLAFDRSAPGATRVAGFNTDIEGVLGPLRRRGVDLKGLTVGILGNGGAARGAVGAFLKAGARPTIYFRNPERGEPVAASLGVPGRPLTDLAAGDQALIVNATPLGLKIGDPSPVPSTVFTPSTLAFDMIYDPPETPFLRAAESAGAAVCISGREMLVCQGLVQFKLFTGETADYEEFEAAFLKGQQARRR